MKKHSNSSRVAQATVAFILILIGLGLIAGAITQALPLASARIQLERDPERGVTGSLSFVLGGVPIFWRSLDGFDHLENQDFQRHHMQNNRYRGQETIYRRGFVNAKGETLAWTERAPVMNHADFISRFITARQDKFEYVQGPAFQISFRDIERGFLALVLSVGGCLLVWLGLRGAFLSLFPKLLKTAGEQRVASVSD